MRSVREVVEEGLKIIKAKRKLFGTEINYRKLTCKEVRKEVNNSGGSEYYIDIPEIHKSSNASEWLKEYVWLLLGININFVKS